MKATRNFSRALSAIRPAVAFLRCEQGLTVTEYAVAAGLIAASLTATFFALGTTIDAIILTVIAFL